MLPGHTGCRKPSDFALVEVDVPDPADGEVLIRNAFMSVDPSMRARMNDVKSYVPPFQVGEVMSGGAVGQVVASRNERFPEGTWVSSWLGWRELALSDGSGLIHVDPALAPISTALGVLGMPGLTAWVGLLDVGRPVEGETVYVSGAAGAVGSLVGQIAKLKGCHVIGSAGSAEKVEWLRELGFDEAFDYRETDPRERCGRASTSTSTTSGERRSRQLSRRYDGTAALSHAAPSRSTTRRSRRRGRGTCPTW